MPGARFNKMILERSIHTVHFYFSINFNVLGNKWFEAGCTLVCTFGDHLSQDDKKQRELLCECEVIRR